MRAILSRGLVLGAAVYVLSRGVSESARIAGSAQLELKASGAKPNPSMPNSALSTLRGLLGLFGIG